jgi:EmrB/QacA subfamily drug resistance transporter
MDDELTTRDGAEHADRTGDRARWAALAVLCAGLLMVILDGTVVTVALPAIQADLDFSPAGLAWVVNAYLIPYGGLLLFAGRLGDLAGRRTVFRAGLLVFTAASVLCGLAPGAALLVLARFAQGIGGALASAVIVGMIVTLFPEPAGQARAIGVFSAVGAAGASIGVLAGGVLTRAASWHWIFFVNAPIGIVAVLLAGRVLRRDRGAGLRSGADAPGAALVTAGLMLLVYAIVGAARYGWRSGHTLGLGALALALLGAFAIRQSTARTPLMRPRVLRSRPVAGANAVQVLMVAAMYGFQFLTALYLQRVLGYDPLGTGLAYLPITVTIGMLSIGASARLTNRYGARGVLLGGLVALLAGMLLLVRAPVGGRYLVDILPPMLLLGVGAGLALPTLTTLGMSGVPAADTGLASGLVNTTQQFGGALGLAVLALLADTRTAGLLAGGAPGAAALTGGYHLAWLTGAALLAAGLLVAVLVIPARHHRQPSQEAADPGSLVEQPSTSGS